MQKEREIKDSNADFLQQQSEIYYSTHIMKEELASVSKNKLRVFEKNEELSEEISRITRKNQRINQDSENLKEFIKNKTVLEEKLMESVKAHEANEIDLANQLMQCRNELLDGQTFYQEFHVKFIHMLMKCNAKIIFKKDQSGEYVTEIHYKGKKESFLFREIDSVYEHPTKNNKLVIKYKNKTKEIFSEEIEKIVTRAREIMQRCMG